MRGLHPGDVVRTVRAAPPLPILLAVLVATLTFPLRALRWRLLLREPDGAWTVDLKSGGGAVREGLASSGVDTTVALAEEDLVAIAKGASVQEIYQQGRLRVDGDIRAARKLGFLKGLA